MDRCLTILPPRPPRLTAFRAALGALWFRVISACQRTLRWAQLTSVRPPRAARASEPGMPVAPLHAFREDSIEAQVEQATPEDDRWLRRTEVLPLGG